MAPLASLPSVPALQTAPFPPAGPDPAPRSQSLTPNVPCSAGPTPNSCPPPSPPPVTGRFALLCSRLKPFHLPPPPLHITGHAL